MSKQRIVKVKVRRFNPTVNEKPYYQTFEVPVPDQKHLFGLVNEFGLFTVSDALEYIYENLDPSLAYYYTCRYGSCRGCECIINGKAKMACHTPIEDAEEIVVEPLSEYTVVRDLIVDTRQIPKEGKRFSPRRLKKAVH